MAKCGLNLNIVFNFNCCYNQFGKSNAYAICAISTEAIFRVTQRSKPVMDRPLGRGKINVFPCDIDSEMEMEIKQSYLEML